MKRIDAGSTRNIVLALAMVMGTTAAAAALARDVPGMTSGETSSSEPFVAVDDPLWPRQWNLNDRQTGIRVADAWQFTRGAGAVVAVIDSGITVHEDLEEQVLPGYDFVSDATDARDGDSRDDDPSDPGNWLERGECGAQRATRSLWDGTSWAGVIAARGNNQKGIAGIAPEAKIVPIRAMPACGGVLGDLVDAITWSAGGDVFGAPTNANPARVIFVGPAAHGPCPELLSEAIQFARSRAAIVVTGATNLADDVRLSHPANCPGVVVVAAADHKGALARYSGYGRGVTLTAPGGGDGRSPDEYIPVTFNTGDRGPVKDTYQVMSGTAVAAAHVAGVAALVVSVRPALMPDEVAGYLTRNARPMPVTCKKPCGSGLLDAAATMAEVASGK